MTRRATTAQLAHRRAIHAEAIAAADGVDANGWRPIATAPKRGQRILLYRRGYREAQAACWWSTEHREWHAVLGFAFHDATHWQPLPEPPSDA
jgi:hypothetical protein